MRLTERTASCGCGAKLAVSRLERLLEALPADPRIRDFAVRDDCAVLPGPEGKVLLMTMDIIPPISDDPAIFGEIAAANAVSDIYAMNGDPLYALAYLATPADLPDSLLSGILEGASRKLEEAGARIVGGHTVEGPELRFGLAVLGEAKEEELWTNGSAKPGDVLILTKPIGTGIYAKAFQEQRLSAGAFSRAEQSMRQLNREARQALKKRAVHACVDVTGFGLAGHAAWMARASEVSVVLDLARVPLLPEVRELLRRVGPPGGAKKNRAFWEKQVDAPHLQEEDAWILFDPQTSGGLLAALPPEEASGFPVIGRVEPRAEKLLKVAPVIN